jgi:pimeloyl-ACP methyl ester carboxylesterase
VRDGDVKLPWTLMLLTACMSGANLELMSCTKAKIETAGAGTVSVPYVVDGEHGALHGTLVLPHGNAPWPIAVIVPGSGAIDRDGNDPGTQKGADTYHLLAAGLADKGIATVRYDKAGVGESRAAAPSHESDMRFEMGAHDVARIVDALKADARFSKVSVVGHSEGSLLGILAAETSKPTTFVSLEGPGRRIGDVLREQVAAKLGSDHRDLAARANAIIASLEDGKTTSDVPADLTALFRPSVQPYLISWMRYDPALELAKLDIPSLVVQGGADRQVSAQDAARLGAARPSIVRFDVAKMNHMLKIVADDDPKQERAYSDPNLPIPSELIARIAAFVR